MKKMRKLIPAFAMLMVAAIMMTTASFAWFTMNDSVTATGMQVQAKASGNLLISTEKMTAADSKISVDLGSSKKELKPITYTEDAGWQTAGSNATVDPTFGTFTGELDDVTTGLDYGTSDYFSDYTIYLATAGDANEMKNQTLYVTLSGLVGADQNIAPAYTVAFYVDANGDDVIDYANDLMKTVNYEDFTNRNGHTPVASIDLDGSFNIPSTYGATADGKVGLMVVMRVYVDGNLDAADQDVPTLNIKKVTEYVSAADDGRYYYNAASMSSYIFYTDAAGKDSVDSSQFHAGTDITAYYYSDGTTTNVPTDTKYVNNAWVPTGATTFSVTIGAKDAPANNG